MSGSGISVAGLASGLDTTSIINQLIAVEKQPITLLQQKKATIQTRRDAWADVTSRFQNLQSALSGMLQSQTIAGNKVTVNTSSGQSAPFSATADGRAVAGTYALTISQLATGTVARGASALGADVVSSDVLNDINLPTPVTAGTFTINDQAIAVDPTTDTLDDVLARINASSAGVTASLVTVDGRQRLQLSANAPGGQLKLGSGGDTSNFLTVTKVLSTPRVGDAITSSGSLGVVETGEPMAQAHMATPVSGTGTLTINGVAIDYDTSTDSLNTLIGRINSSSAGVTASYDAIKDQFVMQSKQTGSLSISMSDTGGVLNALGVADPATQTLGNNAAYSLDGGVTTRYSASNTVTDALSGVTLRLTSTSSTPVSFTVAPDVDSAVAAVQKFVSQYNSTMSFLSSKMSYDADSKTAGPLLGDAGARSLESSVRDMMINAASGVTGPYKTLADVGISFGAYGSAIGSTDLLQVDESKLRDALATNSSAVYQLFAAKSTPTLATPGDVTSVTGAPVGLSGPGHYDVTSDGAGKLTATFYDTNNVAQWSNSETVAKNSATTTLIRGLTLGTPGTYTGATTTINVAYSQGILTSLDQYLSTALADQGTLTLGTSTADNEIKQVDDSISQLNDQITQKQQILTDQFTQMETLVAQFQAQGSALSAQLAGLASGR